jgi:hypothetical protein
LSIWICTEAADAEIEFLNFFWAATWVPTAISPTSTAAQNALRVVSSRPILGPALNDPEFEN